MKERQRGNALGRDSKRGMQGKGTQENSSLPQKLVFGVAVALFLCAYFAWEDSTFDIYLPQGSGSLRYSKSSLHSVDSEQFNKIVLANSAVSGNWSSESQGENSEKSNTPHKTSDRKPSQSLLDWAPAEPSTHSRPLEFRHVRRAERNDRDVSGQVLINRMDNGHPFLFKSKNGNIIIFCTQEKVGSTMWRLVLKRYLTNTVINKPEFDFPPEARFTPPPEGFKKAIASRNVTRIMLIRNPYVRYLSAYLDKIVKDFEIWKQRIYPWLQPSMASINKCAFKKLRHGKPGGEDTSSSAEGGEECDKVQQAGFLQFAREFVSHNGMFEPHFTPQVRHCGLDNGFTYDYYLKVEDLALWYEDFIHHMGLEKTVQADWEHFGQPCFYHTPTRTCEEMFRSCAECEDREQGEGKPVETSHASHHSAGTQKRVKKLYSNESARIVEELYRADFQRLDYPMKLATTGSLL